MAEISALELTAGTAVVAAALQSFSVFCPNMSDVVGDTDGHTRHLLDFGQQAGMVASLSVGAALSYATKSVVPLLWAIGIGLAVSYVFELGFRKGMI